MTVELSMAEIHHNTTVEDMLQLSEANAKQKELESIVANINHEMARNSQDFERWVLEQLAEIRTMVDKAKWDCEDKYKWDFNKIQSTNMAAIQ